MINEKEKAGILPKRNCGETWGLRFSLEKYEVEGWSCRGEERSSRMMSSTRNQG